MTVPDKMMRLRRSEAAPEPPRPVMLAIAGDSAAGKTTLTRGIAEALGADRAIALCVDDYHRYDRLERRGGPLPVLDPAGNHLEGVARRAPAGAATARSNGWGERHPRLAVGGGGGPFPQPGLRSRHWRAGPAGAR